MFCFFCHLNGAFSTFHRVSFGGPSLFPIFLASSISWIYLKLSSYLLLHIWVWEKEIYIKECKYSLAFLQLLLVYIFIWESFTHNSWCLLNLIYWKLWSNFSFCVSLQSILFLVIDTLFFVSKCNGVYREFFHEFSWFS